MNRELFFATGTLDRSYVFESFDKQNVSKVNAVRRLAAGTWSIHNKVILEKEVFGNKLGPGHNKGSPNQGKNDRVQSDDGFNDLESNSQPD